MRASSAYRSRVAAGLLQRLWLECGTATTAPHSLADLEDAL